MKLLSSLLFVSVFSILSNLAQEQLIQNVYLRESTSLNGMWKYIVDPYENGFYNYRLEPFEKQEKPQKSAFFKNAKQEDKTELLEYNFDKSDSISIPSDWNSQKENLFYYEGTVWFKKSFNYNIKKENNRVFVHFGASNYETDVYFNGEKLGKHIGGFTPFNYEITHLLQKKDNFLVVKVDNKRKKEGVPTLNTDWWNYGGITRDVKLIETSSTFINDYFIQLNKNDRNTINGKIQLNGSDISSKEIQIKIPELKINKKIKTDKNGVTTFKISSKKIKYWSNKNPHLYEVFLKINDDIIKDKIGFRTIKTSGSSILLNDEKIYLKGISIHEESPFRGGRGYTKKDSKKLLTWAKELGCNYVRLAHYPHNEHMVRLADEMGILVWEENPVYWTISWKNKETYNNAKNQLAEVISRDKNRASVIIWSMANETPTSNARNAFLTSLAEFTKKEDPTRLISAALEQSDYKNSKTIRTINDDFADIVDVLSFNQYIGWYDGLPEKTEKISWKITQNKPVLISEFGAGAKKGFYADKNTRWSEEFQEEVYVKTLKMLDKIDQLQGLSPWILVDFKSPRRVLPEIQDGYNRKGLISEKGEKKKAFFVLQKFYNSKD
ncbi:glycoside hydrolase family 2 protein [Polaribacter sp. Hel1_85]|uniref:glycoside hydrolase family 2 protein n=1 Tax=Polaribacter sp. Hel1_85 TaxID=1250005 RepID=UPI00052BB11D|nr:glycoside hydrolase family 2 TIM barrel-domain containing protein [Polaribacter sp. Hel1_85]KGL58844.1 putative beta-glucuronidase, GH2 family [Polaribacter sp. Hel1_85]